MNVEEWDRDFVDACLSSVNNLLKECKKGDFLARRTLESHRDELAARIASAGPLAATDSPYLDERSDWCVLYGCEPCGCEKAKEAAHCHYCGRLVQAEENPECQS